MILTKNEWKEIIRYDKSINLSNNGLNKKFKQLESFKNIPKNLKLLNIDCGLLDNLNTFEHLPNDMIKINLTQINNNISKILNSLPNNIKELVLFFNDNITCELYNKNIDTLLITYSNNINIRNCNINNLLDLDDCDINNLQGISSLSLNRLEIRGCLKLKNLEYIPQNLKSLSLIDLNLDDVNNIPEKLDKLYIKRISNNKITNLGKLKYINKLTYDRKESFSNKFIFPTLETLKEFTLDNNTIVKFPKGYKLPNMDNLKIDFTKKNTLTLNPKVLPLEVDNLEIIGESLKDKLKYSKILDLPKVNDTISISNIKINLSDILKNNNLLEINIDDSIIIDDDISISNNQLIRDNGTIIINNINKGLLSKINITNNINVFLGNINLLKEINNNFPKNIKELSFYGSNEYTSGYYDFKRFIENTDNLKELSYKLEFFNIKIETFKDMSDMNTLIEQQKTIKNNLGILYYLIKLK